MKTSTLYPTSPTGNNPNYSSLPSSYKMKAALSILAIILFFVLYFSLIVGLAFLCKWAITYPMHTVNKLTILGKAGAVASTFMLFVFTLKFIFKLKNHKPSNRIKLDKSKNPELWHFIDKICQETGAPKPSSIYVDPDVNAYVSYTNSWLSLILPVKKDLTIGLGLVSCLNLSEFKAVISHEFGHFAQSTMKIGSYIMSANTIIHDMIFERDKWDDFLDRWRGFDIRIAWAAWLITPLIWIIRQVLNLFYQFLNIMYSTLSREMEFNADRVAAMTSGSDAIISALWKLDDGSENWNESLTHLFNASKKNKFVQNVYEHHISVMEENEPEQENKLAALELHPSGGKQFFTGNELSKVSMYASHPPNNLREENVKTPYISCDIDTRSPWLLFTDATSIQQNATALIYKDYFHTEAQQFCDQQEFKAFISNETRGIGILKKYQNIFADRFADIPEKVDSKYFDLTQNELTDKIEKQEDKLNDLLLPLRELEEKLRLAQSISQGTTKLKSFSHNGETYNSKSLEAGYNTVMAAREELLTTNFKEWDYEFFSLNIALAEKLGKKEKVKSLLVQHQSITELFKLMISQKNIILSKLGALQEKDDVTQYELEEFTSEVKRSANFIDESFEKLNNISFVPLSNIDSKEELIHLIHETGNIRAPYGNMFENNTFNIFVEELDQAIGQLQRVEQKSISEILIQFQNQ